MTVWRNRTVRVGDVDLDEITSNPLNWRIHPAYQHQVVDALLDKVGWVRRLILSAETGVLLDGHLRVARARERGEKTAPARWVSLTPEEEALVLYAFDLSTGLAETDAERMAKLAQQVEQADGALGNLLSVLQAAVQPEVAISAEIFRGGHDDGHAGEVRFRIGMFTFYVEGSEYDAWREGLIAAYGDDPHRITQGLLERLQFEQEA